MVFLSVYPHVPIEYIFFCILVSAYIGKPCEVNTDCADIKNGECKNGKHCICNENSTMLNEFACGPQLGGVCSNDMECLTENSKCVDNICRCKSGFSANKNSVCYSILTKLGMACESKADCKDLHNSACIHGQCVCQSNTLAINHTACFPLIGGSCLSNEDCRTANSVCSSNRCECKPQYVPSSSNQCILERLVDDCRSDRDCDDKIRKECSTNKKCVCKSYSIAFRTSGCKSLIGGYCGEDSDCAVINSVCIDNRCLCKFTLTPISLNVCPQSS